GSWSYEQFKIALTKGKYKGLDNGRPLLPPMPWFNYTAMKEEEIQAIFQYLKSTPPVRNLVPAPIPPGNISGQ
ncbi:MAG: diheme cytochrome c-553, partial [Saprospiraceae bacterium]